jgi:hypothetical protein
MNRVFPIPPPIVVPDGTKLHEIVGPRTLASHGDNVRVSDGLSLALGILPAGTVSKVHLHPVVWHFTWVCRGTLTVQMRDASSDRPYRLRVPAQNGVLTEPGTFFQLINEGEEQCEVFYFVGPAFVFELSPEGVRYNDAVVLEESWEELQNLNWRPPLVKSCVEISALRRQSLLRTAASNPLHTVHHERWLLKNGPGCVSVPSAAHARLVERAALNDDGPSDPERIGPAPDGAAEVVDGLMQYLQRAVGLALDKRFLDVILPEIVELKCNQRPAVLAEYELVVAMFSLAKSYVAENDIWHLLLFGQHDALHRDSSLSRGRRHVFDELFDFAVTIGGGFKAVGAMENYRGFRGGLYGNPSSYNHYHDTAD